MDKELFPFGKVGTSLTRAAKAMFQPVLAIIAGLFIGAIIIAFAGGNIFNTYKTLLTGGFGSLYYFSATLTRAVPIVMCGLGAVLAWRAGYYNIGGEGQMIVGGFCATVVALFLPFNGPAGIIVVLLVGALTGGLYAFFAAWLNEKFGVILLISTLMLNYIAHYITFYFVAFPLKDNTIDGIVAKTKQIDPSLWLPRLNWAKGSTFSISFFIVIAIAIAIVFLTRKTVFGYESKMGGLNPDFAQYGGINRTGVMYLTMLLSGALCGLGGTLEVVGLKHLYMHDMLKSPSYAWTGLMAALIAELNPVGTVVCGIFLAGLQTGGAALERNSSIPLEITTIIQAIITLLVSAKLLSKVIVARRQKKSILQEEGAKA